MKLLNDALKQLHITAPPIRSMFILAGLALTALVLVCILVVLQSQRDETRRADTIVVICLPEATQEHLDHAADLYNRGYASNIVLVGNTLSKAKGLLIKSDVPESALLIAENAGGNQPYMRSAALLAYQSGSRNVLLVGNPETMLLHLKMARDLGLKAYGSPLTDEPINPGSVLQASFDYWNYVLFKSDTSLVQ
jgi:hypothetical protein